MHARVLTIQGNASFDRNIARLRYVGVMLLNNMNSKFGGTLYLRHNEATGVDGCGGAICILKGELIIQGNTSFDGNCAKYMGGALYISSAKFIYNSAIIRRGEVYTKNSIMFFHNIAEYGGGSIFCLEECDVGFIGTVYFNHSAESAIYLNQYSCITFTGDTYFHRNRAYYISGGAIKYHDSNITLSGIVYFESNMGNRHGGAVYMTGTSKLIFKPKLNIFFISNHANDSGGALYFDNSQCSLPGSTVEYFITIDSPISTVSDISLHFENNSAGSTGSILYGGQFDKCRLFFRTSTEQPDQCAWLQIS